MSIRVSGQDMYYLKLKEILTKKEVIFLDLKSTLLAQRHDPELIDYLISNLKKEDEGIRKNSVIALYIVLIDFNLNLKLKEEESLLLQKLINKNNIDITIKEIEECIKKEEIDDQY